MKTPSSSTTSAAPTVVYVGALHRGSTALHRWRAIQELTPGWGHRGIDITPWFYERAFGSGFFRFAAAVFGRLGKRIDLRRVGPQIISSAVSPKCQVLWLDKTIRLDPRFLEVVRRRNPGVRIVFYTPDDMANRGNRTEHFLHSLPLYDLVVTTKSFQLTELRDWGAREVVFVDNAYDPEDHRPMILTPEERELYGCGIGFVGGYERERAEILARLQHDGFRVKVFSWDASWGSLLPASSWVKRFVAGEDYSKAIAGARINMGFLRKANRDLQTQRSVEIPGAGGFLLAERSEEHAQLFKEGVEAEYFGDYDELARKARRYLDDEPSRLRVVAAGRARALRDEYSNRGRLAPILAKLGIQAEEGA